MSDREGALAAEVAHHADLGDDHRLCVESSLTAGKRCLRLAAFAELGALANRALKHVAELEDEVRITSHLALLHLLIHGDVVSREKLQSLEETTYRLAGEAESRGQYPVVARAIWELSVLQYRAGDPGRALARNEEQAKAASSADEETRARSLAAYARCLLLVDGDAAQAAAALRESAAIADRVGITINDIFWSEGMLHRHAGRFDEASSELARATHGIEDRSFDMISCLSCQAMNEVERGAYSGALDVTAELIKLSSKMGEVSENPFGLALQALAQRGLGQTGAGEALEQAVQRLRQLDSRAMLAYALIGAAEFDFRDGLFAIARIRATEALDAATQVDRPSEMALARALLARVALADGDENAARAVAPLVDELAPSHRISARARAALLGVANALDIPITTLKTTGPTTVRA
jgi:hypothetical protein